MKRIVKPEISHRMNFKNVSIKRRILLSNISMIIVPILIILIAAPVFLPFADRFMNVNTVTAPEFGMVSQVQWSATVSEMSAEIVKSGPLNNKTLQGSIRSLEEQGSRLMIRQGDEIVYLSPQRSVNTVTEELEIVLGRGWSGEDLFYVGADGLVIASNVEYQGTPVQLVVLNREYKANFMADAQTSSLKDTLHFFIGKLGVLVLCIVGIFALTITVMTILTTNGITRPLTQLRKCTNEIIDGNLDYEMEYDSTNEFGMLIKDYDQMRQRLKDSMEQRDLLEQQRKEMIAGFSHDLRTPLTAIKGYVEGLMDGIASTPEKEKDYLKTIYTTANDMENLVSELFLFSKLDVDKVTLEKENVAIVNYMADCCEEETFELEKSNMELSFSHSCDRMTTVAIDRQQFSRVILNIFSNSVKYKKTGQTGHIDVQVSKNERYALIRITDDGIGIDEESLPHVFETFYRADRARSNVREGSGLGLSICKKIIDLHEGNIWATGKLGEGMTVTIALPLLGAQS